MSNERVDVLAVMDELIGCADYNACGGYPVEGDAKAARAAVAELIELVKEINEAARTPLGVLNKFWVSRITTDILSRIGSQR